jgi:solute:Na+ symporter, SSS family
LGIYWKRSSSTGALLAMVLGMVTWIIFEVYETGWPSLVPATLVSLVAMVVGSMVWPQQQKAEVEAI